MEASSWRVQRTRTLRRAWDKHTWPETDKLLADFKKITLIVDVVKSAAHVIHRSGVKRDSEPPRYWVMAKEKPRRLIQTSSRKQQLVYHEEVSDGDNEEDLRNSDEDEPYSDNEAIDDLVNRLHDI